VNVQDRLIRLGPTEELKNIVKSLRREERTLEQRPDGDGDFIKKRQR